MERERAARRKRDWIKLYVIRFFINFFVVSVLAASLALIYLTNDWSLMVQFIKGLAYPIIIAVIFSICK